MSRPLLLVAAGMFLLAPSGARSAPRFEFLQSIALPASAPGAGVEVAGLSGSYAILLSTPIPTPDPLSRQVHVYERDLISPDRWDHRLTITQPGPTPVAGFARGAAIDGGTLVVTSVNTDNLAAVPDGRAFVFEKDAGGTDNWGLAAELLGSGSGRTGYGSVVAISGDTAAVGADGAVFVFERNAGGSGAWGEVKVLDAMPALPIRLALRGGRLLAGIPAETWVAPGGLDPGIDNAGSAYLFERNWGGAGAWGMRQKFVNPQPLDASGSTRRNARFGDAVGVSGSTVLAGWPGYQGTYDEAGAGWFGEQLANGDWRQAGFAPPPSETDEFDQLGESVAIRGDLAALGNSHGSWPLVVEPDSADPPPLAAATGAVQMFERVPGGPVQWRRAGRIVSPGKGPGDLFGRTLALDGETLLASAAGVDAPAGAVFVFEPKCAAVTVNEHVLGQQAQSLAIEVTAPGDCAWQAYSPASWISVSSSAASTGNGTVLFAVDANEGSSAVRREAAIRIGARDVRIIQRSGAQVFSDVAPGDLFFHPVNRLRELGITAGCNSQPAQFCPGQPIPRWQLAVFLIRAVAGGDSFGYPEQPYFSDVPAEHIAFPWIQKLREWGYTGGCGATAFCPNGLVSREQAAVFMVRLRYGPEQPFATASPRDFLDVAQDNPFRPWILKLADAGITTGCSATNFCPGRPVTRAEMALFLLRAGYNEFFPTGYPRLTRVELGPWNGGNAVIAAFGQNTHFAQGVSALHTGQGLTAPAGLAAVYLVDSDSELAVTVGSDGQAQRRGPYSVLVRTGGEEAVLPNAFILP